MGEPEKTGLRVERDGFARDEKKKRRRRKDDGGGQRGTLLDDVMEVQQGIFHTVIEGAASAMDTATSTGRRIVDRTMSKDYRSSGDFVKNVGRSVQDATKDVIEGLKEAPRRMNDGFYDTVQPKNDRTNRGERYRRSRAADEADED